MNQTPEPTKKTEPAVEPGNIFIARQPIFDREKRVLAYELLFRSGPQNFFAAGTDGDKASSKVINNSLLVFGLDTLIGSKKAYVNITRRVLIDELITVLPHERTVVEMLETIEPDPEVLAACKTLKERGYAIALDDFVCKPGMDDLAALADVLKIDFLVTKGDERRQVAEKYLPQGIQMLAEKVETNEDFQQALDCGYAYFQGYFFCKPEMLSRKEIPVFKINYLRFLQEINRPDLDFEGLEQVIKQEVSLSVGLLRILNSAAFARPAKITSIRQSLVMLGERSIRTWATLIAVTNIGADKPGELVVTSLVRARFCELLAPIAGMASAALDLFLVGILSTVDALVGRPLDEIIEPMPLSDEVKKTLLQGGTRMADVFGLARAYERGEWEQISELSEKLQIVEAEVPDLYRRSVEWADQIFQNK